MLPHRYIRVYCVTESQPPEGKFKMETESNLDVGCLFCETEQKRYDVLKPNDWPQYSNRVTPRRNINMFPWGTA